MELFTKSDLARWYCSFNSFTWPDDFPAPRPDFWTNNWKFWNHSPEQQKLVSALCTVLELMAGEKLCSRMWNSKMSDKEFEEWWSNAQHQRANVAEDVPR